MERWALTRQAPYLTWNSKWVGDPDYALASFESLTLTNNLCFSTGRHVYCTTDNRVVVHNRLYLSRPEQWLELHHRLSFTSSLIGCLMEIKEIQISVVVLS